MISSSTLQSWVHERADDALLNAQPYLVKGGTKGAAALHAANMTLSPRSHHELRRIKVLQEVSSLTL